MTHILEVNEQGILQIPSELLPYIKHTRYHLEIQGETLILHPEKEPPAWATATPEQRATMFRQWATQHKRPPAPALPDEALSRDTIYDITYRANKSTMH